VGALEQDYLVWTTFADSHRVPLCFPDYMRKAVSAYLLDGKPMGGYLMALFGGRPFDAVCNADGANFATFAWQCKWIAQMAPGDSFGSGEKVRDWIDRGGLRGIEGGEAHGA